MEIIEVASDIDRSRRLYKKYFAFERKRSFRKNNIMAITITALIIILAGFVFAVPFLSALGAVVLCLLCSFLIVSMIRYQISCNRFLRDLGKQLLQEEKSFTFQFDDERITYESLLRKSELKWQLISGYCLHEGDIYLYTRQGQLFDIVSESILGKENFNTFRSLAESKLIVLR